MTELISRREALKRLAGLSLVAAGFGSAAGETQASAESSSPLSYGNGEHGIYHAARKIFPVVMGEIHVAGQVQQQIDCPIYMFHEASGRVVEGVLYDNLRVGRLPVTVSRLTKIILGEEDSPIQPVFCMTFDDGYLIQYQQAFPVLKKYSAPAAFYVMGTGWQGDGVHYYMSPEQIREIWAAGFEIGSHTVNHPPSLIRLRAQNRGAYLAELFDSKTQLEELLTPGAVTTFAYPNGVFDGEMMQDISTQYRAAVTTRNFRVQGIGLLYALGRNRK